MVPAPAQHPGLVADCEVLVALRAELFGRAGTNWTADNPLSYWDGVVVGISPVRVRELVLDDGAIGRFDHGGRLSPGIAELDLPRAAGALQEPAHGGRSRRRGGRCRGCGGSTCRANELTGAIPAALGQLRNLGGVAARTTIN